MTEINLKQDLIAFIRSLIGKRQNDKRAEFLALASHEVKMPLTALKLQVEMAQKEIDRHRTLSKDKFRAIINRTHQDILRLSRMVEELEDVSRININKLSIQREFFNLEEFFEQVLQKATEEIEEIRRPLISINAPVLVCWDRKRMEQIILICLSQAFSFEEKHPLEIKIQSGGGLVFIELRNRHKSLSSLVEKKLRDLLLDRGRNLYDDPRWLRFIISRNIIQLHRGEIHLKNNRRNGMIIEISIPQT